MGRRGRPRKYFTDEERKEARKQVCAKYYAQLHVKKKKEEAALEISDTVERKQRKCKRKKKAQVVDQPSRLTPPVYQSQLSSLPSTPPSLPSTPLPSSSPDTRSSFARSFSPLPPSSPPPPSPTSDHHTSLETSQRRFSAQGNAQGNPTAPKRIARKRFGLVIPKERGRYIRVPSDSESRARTPENNTLPEVSSVENSPHSN
ncbi:hypothetical protein K435DRAFT_860040 [Dendrothele bispora CBS 962.96]|uniref:Uncharacterized protein n=1 Tax=Dendrothele bispora (strain CBS 962.96) TaxID=1314807 RepID=A0A4S8M074_DENBC|nr:hypothetical protein K435DRAFT_860040 [Dendrothele bispora CBS 962.96]